MNTLKAKDKVKVLYEALPYIREFFGKVFVVKVGGSLMKDESLLLSFARDVTLLKFIGIKPVVVHGGGMKISSLLERLGIESHFSGGMRITTPEVMEVVEMALCKINKDLVSRINTVSGGNVLAVGLTGKDGNLILAKKLSKSYYTSLGLKPPERDLGFVGEVKSINTKLLDLILRENLIPVLAPVGVDEEGNSYNINADLLAYEVAKYLRAEKLIFLTDTEGVKLKDGVISTLKEEEALKLIKEGKIRGGMIPKVRFSLLSLKAGVRKVHIIDGRRPSSILLEIFTREGIGTEIVL